LLAAILGKDIVYLLKVLLGQFRNVTLPVGLFPEELHHHSSACKHQALAAKVRTNKFNY